VLRRVWLAQLKLAKFQHGHACGIIVGLRTTQQVPNHTMKPVCWMQCMLDARQCRLVAALPDTHLSQLRHTPHPKSLLVSSQTQQFTCATGEVRYFLSSSPCRCRPCAESLKKNMWSSASLSSRRPDQSAFDAVSRKHKNHNYYHYGRCSTSEVLTHKQPYEASVDVAQHMHVLDLIRRMLDVG
jgi:hypothetical protein